MLKSRIEGAGFYVIIFHHGYLKKKVDTNSSPLARSYLCKIHMKHIITSVFFLCTTRYAYIEPMTLHCNRNRIAAVLVDLISV
jgi:hypothetical protein